MPPHRTAPFSSWRYVDMSKKTPLPHKERKQTQTQKFNPAFLCGKGELDG